MSRLSSLDQMFGSNKISQSWHDLYIWDVILDQYPPARILELGTFTGGMAVYLHIQAQLRGADFQTFDINHYNWIRKERFDSPFRSTWNLAFTELDVRSPEGIQHLTELIQRPGRTVILCDNGAKEEEVAIYTPIIKPDDILAVHDWGTECSHVPDELILVTPIEGIYEELESMTRFFTK